MPNIKSAKKRLRQSEKRYAENIAVRSRIKTERKNFLQSIEGGDAEASDKAFRQYCSVLDKAVKTGRIKKNTAIRRKARAAEKVRAKASA